MGDRANVNIREDDDTGVYLYTHWGGSELPEKLRQALAKKWRWNDSPYLARIIFDVIADGMHGKETGLGISAYIGDGEDRILVVDCEKQTVSFNGKSWTFDDYINLSMDKIKSVWIEG